MRRISPTASLALLIVAPIVAGAPLPAQAPLHAPIYLDENALATIERTNADHFRRITAILVAASEMPCQSERFARVIEAAYDARDGRCELGLLTSYPPKRKLSFSLDQTPYAATVRVKDDSKLIPAK